MKKFLFICLSIILCHKECFSQGNIFKEGFVIGLKNDTIYGLICDSNSFENARYCKFRKKTSNDIITFSPDRIKAYFVDSKYYISKKIPYKDNSSYFLEYIINGIIDLYYFSNDLKEDNYLAEKNGKFYIMNNSPNDKYKYHRILKYITFEKTELAKEINDVEFDRKSLARVVKDYHVIMDEKYITYEKENPGNNNDHDFQAVYSLRDFRPGFVILKSGDTLVGEINNRDDYFMAKQCVFRTSKDRKTRRFTPDSIQGYRFINGKYYISSTFKTADGNKTLFLEYMIKGKLSVYYYRDDTDRYLIEKDGKGIMELPYKQDILFSQEANSNYIQESTKHQDRLKYYTKEAPELKADIEAMAKPERNDLIKLSEKYQRLVCRNPDSCVVFYKRKPFVIKIKPEVLIGFISYDNNVLYPKTVPILGALIHIWIPRASERLFFKTGIFYSEFQCNLVGPQQNIRIPMHLEYLHSRGIIRPTFSIGPNFNSAFVGFIAASANAGIKIKLYKTLNLSANADMELTGSWVSYSFVGGLYFDL